MSNHANRLAKIEATLKASCPCGNPDRHQVFYRQDDQGTRVLDTTNEHEQPLTTCQRCGRPFEVLEVVEEVVESSN